MKILVTGGAGYVGGSVATILLEAGHQVTVIDNLCHSKRDQVPKGVDFVECDIADRPRVEALLRSLQPDGVMHFAALIEAGESMQQPEIYFSCLRRCMLQDSRSLSSVPLRLCTANPSKSPSRRPRDLSPQTPMASRSCWWSECYFGLGGSAGSAMHRYDTLTLQARCQVEAKRMSQRPI